MNTPPVILLDSSMVNVMLNTPAFHSGYPESILDVVMDQKVVFRKKLITEYVVLEQEAS